MTENAAETLMALHLDELGRSHASQYYYAKGRKLRGDFAIWDDPRNRKLIIEVVGGVYRKGGAAHGSITGILKDIDRLNAATLNGWYMMRFTPQQVESGEAKAWVKEWVEGAGHATDDS